MPAPSPGPAPRFYLPAEVARMFRVDAKTVSRWAKEGRLETRKTPGGHRRYLADQVDAMLRRMS